ncbi:hypothetical protein [Streptomyces sp. NPDC004008]
MATDSGLRARKVIGWDPPAADQFTERRCIGRQFVRAMPQDDQEGKFLHPHGERGQPGEGLQITPVRIVNDHDDRRFVHGELCEHPVQTVPDALWIRHGGTGLLGQEADGRPGDLVPATEDLATFGLGAGSPTSLAILRVSVVWVLAFLCCSGTVPL